ncbi:DivIVA domain-containing protein [Raoultibacter phocaeensis]|uniref:DivIVA domain-containing protein n=1 Tax=Raoultibacter phocaeensis TaxID=2479841 RepID=UPI0015D5858F|nr:DivIVA domain-containing protein [Raoultibacter phocaeensis]
MQALEFKKKNFGGCDEEDALAKIHELAALYQAELDRLEKRMRAAEERAADYERRQAEVRQLMTAAQNMKDTMLAKADEEARQKTVRAEREAQKLIDNAAADAEDILAKATADSIVIMSNAKDEAARLRSESESERARARDEAEREAEESKRVLRESISALLETQVKVKADVKSHTDTAYAKAKVANDNLTQIVELLAELKESASL